MIHDGQLLRVVTLAVEIRKVTQPPTGLEHQQPFHRTELVFRLCFTVFFDFVLVSG